MAVDTRPTINIRDLVQALKNLPPDMSVLLVGPHGIGKSQIARQLAEHFEIPFIDRRLAQMSEGDMVGMPKISDDVTRFLPVDWFKKGCSEPVMMCLDELNRATLEIMNAAFQIVLDREMNGNVLHKDTRVIACVNSGAYYSVNDMDLALVNRFAVFHLEPDEKDWMTWAAGPGNIDPVVVDFIRHHPEHLRNKDLDTIEPMTAHCTPRSWARLDQCLKYAGMAPSDVAGEDPPGSFYSICVANIGPAASIALSKFVRSYSRVITATDVLDRWEAKKSVIAKASHDEITALLSKIGDHCKKNDWTEEQVTNLVDFADTCFTGEDYLSLFTKIMSSKNHGNISLVHRTPVTAKIMAAVNTAEKLKRESS